MKSKLMIFLLLISVAGFSQIRHDQLRKPVVESTDTVLMFKNTSMGFEYTRTVLDTTIIKGLDLFVKERVSDSTSYLLGRLNDTVTYILGQIPTTLVELDSSGLRITESQISDLKNYLTIEVDPVYSSWDKSSGISITESQISDLKAYLLSEVDPIYSLDSAKIVWFKDLKFTQDSLKTAVDSIQSHNLRLLGKQNLSDTLTYDATKYDLEQLKLADLDSTGFSVDTTQVRDLLEFVQNNGGSGSGDGYWEEISIGNDTITTNKTPRIDKFTMGQSTVLPTSFVYLYSPRIMEADGFYSTDNAVSFTSITDLVGYTSSDDGQIQYRAYYNSDTNFAKITRTTDYGATWDIIFESLVSIQENAYKGLFIRCSEDGQTVAYGYDDSFLGRQILVSKNQGSTWTTFTSITSGLDLAELEISPNGSYLLVVTGTVSYGTQYYASRINLITNTVGLNLWSSTAFIYGTIDDLGNMFLGTFTAANNRNEMIRIKADNTTTVLFFDSFANFRSPFYDKYEDRIYYFESSTLKYFTADPSIDSPTRTSLGTSSATANSISKAESGNIFVNSNVNGLYLSTNDGVSFTNIYANTKREVSINNGVSGVSIVDVNYVNGKMNITQGGLTMNSEYTPSGANDVVTLGFFTENNAGSFNLSVREWGETGLQGINILEFIGADITNPSTGVAKISIQGGSGGGDMYRSTYDTNFNNIVDNAEALGGVGASSYATLTGTQSLLNKTINGVSLTSIGNGSSFLSNDGTYKAVSGSTPSGTGIPTINSGAWGTTISPSNGYLNYNNGTWSFSTPSGGGDMFKATYDTNSNNIVDNSEALGGVTASNYATLTGNQALTNKSVNGVTLSSTGNGLSYLSNDGTYKTITSGGMVYPSFGLAKSTGSAWATSIPDNSTNWNTAYNDRITSLAFSGTTTKTLTLTQSDGGTVVGSFTDLGGGDMLKSTYDTNSNNIVDNSESLGGVAASNYATLTGSQSLTNKSVNGVTLSTAQGTSNFLRGDGTYATPSSGIGGSSHGQILFNRNDVITGDNNFRMSDNYTPVIGGSELGINEEFENLFTGISMTGARTDDVYGFRWNGLRNVTITSPQSESSSHYINNFTSPYPTNYIASGYLSVLYYNSSDNKTVFQKIWVKVQNHAGVFSNTYTEVDRKGDTGVEYDLYGCYLLGNNAGFSVRFKTMNSDSNTILVNINYDLNILKY